MPRKKKPEYDEEPKDENEDNERDEYDYANCEETFHNSAEEEE